MVSKWKFASLHFHRIGTEFHNFGLSRKVWYLSKYGQYAFIFLYKLLTAGENVTEIEGFQRQTTQDKNALHVCNKILTKATR